MLFQGIEETALRYLIGGLIILGIFIACCLIHNKLIKK
jgi:hypothetical protein